MSKSAVVRNPAPTFHFRPIRSGTAAEYAAARLEAKATLARGSHIKPCPCGSCVEAALVKLAEAPFVGRPWK